MKNQDRINELTERSDEFEKMRRRAMKSLRLLGDVVIEFIRKKAGAEWYSPDKEEYSSKYLLHLDFEKEHADLYIGYAGNISRRGPRIARIEFEEDDTLRAKTKEYTVDLEDDVDFLEWAMEHISISDLNHFIREE